MLYEIGIIADGIRGRAGIRIEFPKIPAKTRRSDKPRGQTITPGFLRASGFRRRGCIVRAGQCAG